MNDNNPKDGSTKTSQGKLGGRDLGILQIAAFVALVVGGIGSLIFMFRAGQESPRFLLVLFTFWVLAPFVALLWANRFSKRWSVQIRVTLYCVTLIVSLGSLAVYSEWINVKPAGSANAFLFVAVPPASLLFMAIVIPIAAFLSGKLSRQAGGK